MPKKKKIPVFHIEAGNRCFDDRVPEEVNRRVVDHFSDINLTYSSYASENLQKEGIQKDRIIKVGSPLMEVYEKYKIQINKSNILKNLNLLKSGYILASIHREENVDDINKLKIILSSIYEIKKKFKLPVIFTTHPRTKKNLNKIDKNLKKQLKFLNPFGFIEYASLLKNAYLTISDSGSITEESSILSVPCINLRSTNERQEGMEYGTVIMSGLKSSDIISSCEMALNKRNNQKIYPDYSYLDVSGTVVNIIQSYTHFVNEKVWLKKI